MSTHRCEWCATPRSALASMRDEHEDAQVYSWNRAEALGGYFKMEQIPEIRDLLSASASHAEEKVEMDNCLGGREEA